jgi:hypothetical protein
VVGDNENENENENSNEYSSNSKTSRRSWLSDPYHMQLRQCRDEYLDDIDSESESKSEDEVSAQVLVRHYSLMPQQR